MQLTLDSNFMTLPTSCAPATVTLNGESASFTPTGCDAGAVQPRGRRPRSRPPSAPSRAARRSRSSCPTGDSHVRRAEIVLPVGHDALAGRRERARGLHRRRSSTRTELPGRVAGRHRQLRHAAAPDARRQGLLRRRLPALHRRRRQRRAGQARRRRAPGPGDGPDHDGLRQPAAGPVHAFALSFQGGPQAVLSNPTTCGEKALSAIAHARGAATAPKTATATLHDRPGLRARPAFAPGAAGRRGLHRGRPPGRRGDDGDHAARRRAGHLAGHDRAAARPGRQPEGRAGLRRGAGRRGHLPGGDARRPRQRAGRRRRRAGRAGRHGVAHRPGRTAASPGWRSRSPARSARSTSAP